MKIVFSHLLLITAYASVFSQTIDFSADNISGCAPLLVTFSDLSTGNPDSWQWDFGKTSNNTSSEQNPSTTYTEPGVYSVKLTVSVNGSTSSTIKEQYIVVHHDPSPDFAFTQSASCKPSAVNFQDLSSDDFNDIVSWHWVFGDGNNSTEQNPTNTYMTPGEYDVTLTIENSQGCNKTIVRENYVKVGDIRAGFSTTTPKVCNTPAIISFQNDSSGPGGLNYLWEFGDGLESQATSPVHAYTEPGTYSVKLTVTNSEGCTSTLTRNDYIVVTDKSVTTFQQSAATSCAGEVVTFTDLSTQNVISRSWDFGNGAIGHEPEQSMSFESPGQHLVTLTQKLDDGCVLQQQQTHTVVANPVADFDYAFNCDGSVAFENKSEHSNSWLWEFGDGSSLSSFNPAHTYHIKSTFTVTLTAFNSLGCESKRSKTFLSPAKFTVDFEPNDIFPSETDPGLGGCVPRTIQFVETSIVNSPFKSLFWDFGDGTTSSERNPAHTFTKAGTYPVKLSVRTELGCVGELSRTVSVTDIVPEPNFEISKKVVCVGELVSFTNLSVNADTYHWDMGFTAHTTQGHTEVAFPAAGIYDVTLTASNSGCSKSITVTNAVTVVNPSPSMEIALDCNKPFTRQFINSSVGADSWQWDFGDGSVSNTHSPFHTFKEAGRYRVKLIVGNKDTGCQDVTISRLVDIVELSPGFEVSNQSLCRKAEAVFTDTSISSSSWFWDFSDGTRSSEQHPEKVFDTPGIYSVGLTVSDVNGCSKTIVKKDLINVADLEADFAVGKQSHCDFFMAEFRNATTHNDPLSFKWDFGDGNYSEEKSPKHKYTKFGKYSPSLTVTSPNATCVVRKENLIEFNKPQASFDVAKTDVCVDEELEITNLSSHASFFKWSIDGAAQSSEPIPKVSFEREGIYDLSLVAIDNYGCKDSLMVKDYISVTSPKISVVATNVTKDCPPLVASFKAESSSDIQTWQWDFGDGNSATVKNPTHTYTYPGNYDVTLVGVNEFGCQTTITHEDLVTVAGPRGTFNISQTDICVGDEVLFSSDTEYTTGFTWDFGDGNLGEQSAASHLYKSPGTFSPILLLEDANECIVAVTSQAEISVRPIPTGEIMVEPDVFFTGEPVRFQFATTSEPTNWAWHFGDGNGSADAAPVHAFSNGGTIPITVLVTGGNNCQAQFMSEIHINQDLTMIPNVFTPNGDNYNERFEIVGLEKSSWTLTVVNRWGKVVYHNSDYQNQWDGGNLPAGIYYYHVKNHHRDISYEGYLHLLR